MSNLRIDIASEFTGRKAFQEAEKSTSTLEKSVESLGKKMAAAFSAYQVAQFAKSSVKAFAEDQKAAALLAKTLENVGQGYQTGMVNDYIAKTEALYGVLDDKLRPAFASLLVATKDAVKSQQLLQTALDVSAGTGKDLDSVTAALSKAYLGNTTALARLGAGLSAAQLKGKSFNDIIAQLNQNFSGSAATAADTFQGKLDKLNVAFVNMKEVIGGGIVGAFDQLDTSASFNSSIDKMGKLAKYIADIEVGLGVIAAKLQQFGILNALGDALNKAVMVAIGPAKPLLDQIAKLGAKASIKPNDYYSQQRASLTITTKTSTVQKTQLATSKALTKEKQQQAALDALSLKYLQAAKIFNEEQIQIAAALQNKNLSAEDLLRLNLKKDILALQEAINNKDVEGATALANKISLEYQQLGLYQAAEKSITSINDILKNLKPIDLINIQNLQDALALLLKLNIPLTPAQQAQAAAGQAQVDKAISNILASDLPNALAEQDVTSYLGTPFNPNVVSNYGVGNPNLQNVTVTIVDNTSGLIDVVTNATQQATANGNNVRLVRNTGGLSW